MNTSGYHGKGFTSKKYATIYLLLELEQNKFRERSTLGGAVMIMINGSKISVHRFIATTLFRMIEG